MTVMNWIVDHLTGVATMTLAVVSSVMTAATFYLGYESREANRKEEERERKRNSPMLVMNFEVGNGDTHGEGEERRAIGFGMFHDTATSHPGAHVFGRLTNISPAFAIDCRLNISYLSDQKLIPEFNNLQVASGLGQNGFVNVDKMVTLADLDENTTFEMNGLKCFHGGIDRLFNSIVSSNEYYPFYMDFTCKNVYGDSYATRYRMMLSVKRSVPQAALEMRFIQCGEYDDHRFDFKSSGNLQAGANTCS
jgi:hypothetical protein